MVDTVKFTVVLILLIKLSCTVQLNSNLTLSFDHLHVFTDFIRVSDQQSRVFCE